MSCRTMLLSRSLFGANLLLGQNTSQKSALAQLSGSIRELTDRAPAVVEVIVNGYGASDDGGRISNQISRRQSSGSGVYGAVFVKIRDSGYSPLWSPARSIEFRKWRRFRKLRS